MQTPASFAAANPVESSTPPKRPDRWAARVGLAIVLAVLVGCFGVLIAASRGSTLTDAHDAPAHSGDGHPVNAQVAAVSPATPAR